MVNGYMEQHCVLQIWKEMLGHKDYTIAQVNHRTLTPYPAEVIEVEIDGRTFWVRPVNLLGIGQRQCGGPSLGGITRLAFGMSRRVLLRQRGT